MSLRVAFDVTSALTQRAGVGRYTRELYYALHDLADPPELLPFFAAPRSEYPLEQAANLVQIKRGIRAWRFEVGARQVLRQLAHGPWDGAQLYHAPDIVFPPVRPPVVTTVHDLSYIVYPQFHTRLNGGYLRLMTPLMTRRARLIIAVSEATRRDLVERVGVPERKIRVVHSGIAPIFMQRPPDEQIAHVRQQYALQEPFILSVGTQEPRKNLQGTLAAYRQLCQSLPAAPLLALVGGAGWRLDSEELDDSSGRVRRLGFLPDADLAALYASCACFLYPSFYEGWGLPVAEAMALGAPTITSHVSSLPEVAGNAALLIAPDQTEEISAALERVLTDTQTATRLRQEGPRQVARFTMHNWAEATYAVYREAARR